MQRELFAYIKMYDVHLLLLYYVNFAVYFYMYT
jgi:hypothetical protein